MIPSNISDTDLAIFQHLANPKRVDFGKHAQVDNTQVQLKVGQTRSQTKSHNKIQGPGIQIQDRDWPYPITRAQREPWDQALPPVPNYDPPPPPSAPAPPTHRKPSTPRIVPLRSSSGPDLFSDPKPRSRFAELVQEAKSASLRVPEPRASRRRPPPFVAVPVSEPADVPSLFPSDEDEQKRIKTRLLQEVRELERQGYAFIRRPVMEDPVEDIQCEVDHGHATLEMRQVVNFVKDGIPMVYSGLEMLNTKFGPFLPISGFSDELLENMSKNPQRYNYVLERCYRKYWRKGSMSPALEFLWIFVAPLLLFVAKKKVFENSNHKTGKENASSDLFTPPPIVPTNQPPMMTPFPPPMMSHAGFPPMSNPTPDQSHAQTRAQTEAQTRAQSGAQTQTEAQARAQTRAQAQTQAQTQAQARAQTQAHAQMQTPAQNLQSVPFRKPLKRPSFVSETQPTVRPDPPQDPQQAPSAPVKLLVPLGVEVPSHLKHLEQIREEREPGLSRLPPVTECVQEDEDRDLVQNDENDVENASSEEVLESE